MKEGTLKRREFLILSGFAAMGMLGPRAAMAQAMTIRQGYQTNIWGMPTYYLLRSGHLEKRMTIAGNDFGDQPSETDERKGDEEPTYRLHHILLNPEV